MAIYVGGPSGWPQAAFLGRSGFLCAAGRGRRPSLPPGIATPPEMGPSAGEIRATIMQVRDLSRKGSLKGQREYAERTAGKAVRQAEE